MSVNWSSIGQAVSSALSAAGSAPATVTSALSALFKAQNPNETDELAICAQILVASGNPALQGALAVKLATEVGIPSDAAALAMTLGNTGVDVPSRVLQIEQLIRSGG